MIRVHFIDDSFKTLAVGNNITGRELLDVVANKIELEEAGRPFFGLYFYKSGESRCVEDEEQVCRLMVHETLGTNVDSNKYINERAEWEIVRKQWEKDCKLVYKRTVFLKYKAIPKEHVQVLNYSYIQSVFNVKHGFYPCNKEVALELAGLQMQADFGDYNPKLHVPGFIVEKDKVANLIPEELLKADTTKRPEEWEKEIFSEHSKLKGMSKEDAKVMYLQKVRNSKFYGANPWNVAYVSKDVWSNVIPDIAYLIVNSFGIEIWKMGRNEQIAAFDYRDLKSWGYSRNKFSFTSTVVGKKFQFSTPFAKDIIQILNAHVRAIKLDPPNY